MGTYFCLDTKVAKDQAEVFKTGSLILRWIILKVLEHSWKISTLLTWKDYSCFADASGSCSLFRLKY